MGRQAHVTRLALGRSPFGEPLRDENGNFILGPHAHDNEAQGYRQQFDDRGHPYNRASKSAAKRLRKAQNDVLAAVGVVVKKGEQRKSKWERLEDPEKFDIVYHENETGSLLLANNRLLGVMLPWAVTSLRSRLLTFGSFASLPLAVLFTREYTSFGLSDLSLAGLPLHCLGGIPQLIRYYGIFGRNVEAIVNFTDPWPTDLGDETIRDAVKSQLILAALHCIEMPLLVHATLQSLHIIPSNVGPSWRSFIPFTAQSPIPSPLQISLSTNRSGIVNSMHAVLQAPWFLYPLRDAFQIEIGYRLYLLFRQLMPKPDKPDFISSKVSDEKEFTDEASIAGVGTPWSPLDPDYEKGKRFFGSKSFFGAVRIAFPPIYKLMNACSRGRIARSRGRLTPLLDRQLRATVRQRYWYDRSELTPVPRRGSPEDTAFRRHIVKQVFKFANLDPTEELVDYKAWTDDVLGPKADVLRVQAPLRQNWDDDDGRLSHPTSPHERINTSQYSEAVSSLIAEAFRIVPQSDAVIIQASDGEVVMFSQQASTDSTNVAEMDNIRTLQATEVPLEALIQGMRELQPDAEQVQHPDHAQRQQQPETNIGPMPPVPSTPTPGIARARSLTDPPALRPLRRPTETDDSLAAISETLRAEAEALQSPRPSQPEPVAIPNPATQPQSLNQTIGNEARAHEPPLIPLKHRQFRVTILSNLPADSLAWHASAILTSLILWPLESMWLRSVASWAARNPALSGVVDPYWSARVGFGVIGRPVGVLGLGTWFGGATTSSGRLRYVGGVLVTLGLEGMVRGLVWRFGVWWVKRWREWYGWSQF